MTKKYPQSLSNDKKPKNSKMITVGVQQLVVLFIFYFFGWTNNKERGKLANLDPERSIAVTWDRKD